MRFNEIDISPINLNGDMLGKVTASRLKKMNMLDNPVKTLTGAFKYLRHFWGGKVSNGQWESDSGTYVIRHKGKWMFRVDGDLIYYGNNEKVLTKKIVDAVNQDRGFPKNYYLR